MEDMDDADRGEQQGRETLTKGLHGEFDMSTDIVQGGRHTWDTKKETDDTQDQESIDPPSTHGMSPRMNHPNR